MPFINQFVKEKVRGISRSISMHRSDQNINLVLHLGAHKTGTSLIQKYMRDNKGLMEANRIGYTLRAQTNQYIGWGRPEHLNANLPEFLSSFNKFVERKFLAVVVSHENSFGRPFQRGKPGLYPGAAEAIEVISNTVRQLCPHIVYYIRSQETFLESYYLQSIHEGGHSTFSDWKSSIDTKDISWRPLIETMRTTFGEDAVTVKDFEMEISMGQQIFLRNFFEIFVNGLNEKDFENFSYEKFRNPSIGELGLQIALAANPFLKTAPERKAMREFLQTKFSNISYPRPMLFDQKEKEEIKARYFEENGRLVTRRS